MMLDKMQLEKHINYFEQTPEEDVCIEMHELIDNIENAIENDSFVGEIEENSNGRGC